MMRDAKEAMKLTSRVSQHTTPIALPRFTMVDGVAVLAHSSVLGANPTGVRDEKQIAACDDLRLKLQANSGDWDSRQQLVYMLYDQGVFHEAASVIWDANPVPSIDLDLAFAARILANFSDKLPASQKTHDALAELGALTLKPEANTLLFSCATSAAFTNG